MNKTSNVLWGIAFVVVGLIIGLNAVGLTDINIFFDGWWTLFIIVPCLIGLFENEGRIVSLIGLTIGIVLLLATNNLIEFELIGKLILPFALIAIGVSIIINGIATSSITKKIKSVDKNGLPGYTATFSGIKQKIQGEKFIGANIDAIFGGVDLDLTGAILEQESVINASAIFGGITIKVPQNVNVKVKCTAVFGGTGNKVVHKIENAPTIYVNALAMFGGVDIK